MTYVECRDHDLLVSIYEKSIRSIQKEARAIESKIKVLNVAISKKIVGGREYAKLIKKQEELKRKLWLILKKQERLEFFIRYMKHLDEQVSTMRKNAEIYTELQHRLIIQEMMTFLLANDHSVKQAIAVKFDQINKQNSLLLATIEEDVKRINDFQFKFPQLIEPVLTAVNLQINATTTLHKYLIEHGNNTLELTDDESFKTEETLSDSSMQLYTGLIKVSRARVEVLEQAKQLKVITNSYLLANTEHSETKVIKNQIAQELIGASNKLIENYTGALVAIDQAAMPRSRPLMIGSAIVPAVKPTANSNSLYLEDKTKPVLLPNPKPKALTLHYLVEKTEKQKLQDLKNNSNNKPSFT